MFNVVFTLSKTLKTGVVKFAIVVFVYNSVTFCSCNMLSVSWYILVLLTSINYFSIQLSYIHILLLLFLNYLQFQLEQPTTSSAADTNHGATQIYFAFNIFVLFLFCIIYDACYLRFCKYCNSG